MQQREPCGAEPVFPRARVGATIRWRMVTRCPLVNTVAYGEAERGARATSAVSGSGSRGVYFPNHSNLYASSGPRSPWYASWAMSSVNGS